MKNSGLDALDIPRKTLFLINTLTQVTKQKVTNLQEPPAPMPKQILATLKAICGLNIGPNEIRNAICHYIITN